MRIELAAGINKQQVIGILDLKKLADNGNSDASNLLGIWLLSGLNCSPDVHMAAEYFEKAAKKGNTTAMINLALCYAEGRGVEKDFDKAEMWIRAADELGDKNANVPARQIYISTIGHHQPNVREYADFLFQSFYPNGTDLDEATMKNTLLANMVLSEVGKATDWDKLSKTKLSDNDIKSFEIMNDVYYGDPVETLSSHLSDTDINAVLDEMLFGINEFSRDDLAERAAVLYRLCSDDKQQKQVKNIGNESIKNFDCNLSLSWFSKAKYGITPSVIGGISIKLTERCVSALREKLNAIENEELAQEFSVCENDLNGLIATRKRLTQSKQHSDEIKNSWLTKITERIIELENSELAKKFAAIENDSTALNNLRAELKVNKMQYEDVIVETWKKKVSDRIFVFIDEQLTQKFEPIQNDYDALYKMLRSLRQDEQEQAIMEKWDALLSEHIVIAQKSKLAELCSSINGKSHQELTALVKLIKEKYSFDNAVSQSYIANISKLLAVIEKQTLDELVANIEGLSSTQYEELIAKIENLRFDSSNTKPYIEIVSNHKNCAIIIETCTDDNLSSWELVDLEKYIDVITASTLSDTKKKELTNMVDSFVSVFRECRDKKTLQLLQNCETENLEKHTTVMLRKLRNDISSHQLLPQEVKSEIVTRIDEQLSMREIEQILSNAEGNYGSMVSVFSKISSDEGNLPQDYRAELVERIRNNIISLQKEALSKLTTGIEKMQHSQIKEAIADARHFNFDKELLDKAISVLDNQLDIVENQKLAEICGGISDCTIEDIANIREKVRKLGYKDINIRPFKAKIDARYGDLVFADLSKKCTQWNLSQLATTEDGVAKLLSELQNCGKDELELEPYVKRVTSFTKVQSQLRADVTSLYQRHFEELQTFVVTEMSKLTFPQYSRLNVMCEFDPNNIKQKLSRYSRFKIEGLEQIVFIFDDSPCAKTFNEGFCITNLAIHCLTDGKIKYIPIESITEIKTGKLFGSISINGTSDSFKVSVQEDFAVRNALANSLQRIISIANERKRMASNENQALAASYSSKYDECFANTPIPNDKTFADRAMEIKKEDEQKAEAIASAPELSVEELMNVIPELVNKYGLSVKYPVVGTQAFSNKLPKARAAYAPYDQNEFPLLLEDHTIFGSAKDGFVLTNKALYMHIGGTNGKISIERFVSAFDSYNAKMKMHYICMNVTGLDTTNGNAYMSYCGDEATANKLLQFWSEILELLHRGKAQPINDAATTVSTENAQPVANPASVKEEGALWLCNCGKTSEGRFCPDCGAKSETGTPLWKCSCGNYNKGKFCPKCGSQKP